MFTVMATLMMAAVQPVRADLPPCVSPLRITSAGAGHGAGAAKLSPSLSLPDPLGDFTRQGTFSNDLVERIHAVHQAGPYASTHRRDELEGAAEVLARIDRTLNDVPGGNEAPYNSVGSGRADYAIYRGFRGAAEIITIRRFRDRFLFAIEVVEDQSGNQLYRTTGLNGTLADALEAIKMTAHRFPVRRSFF